MIRFSVLVGILLLAPSIQCFAPLLHDSPSKTTTALQVTRRDSLSSVAAFAVAATAATATPFTSLAAQQKWEDRTKDQTQLPKDGKLDLNSAFVVCLDYFTVLHFCKCNQLSLHSSAFYH